MKKPRRPEKGRSLADQNPELASQWHPSKNGILSPFDVRAGSTIKAWWKCPVDDDHEWIAVIADRHRGIGCPACSNYKVVKSNCLSTLNPRLASEWHPTRNGNLLPSQVHPGSSKRAWWKCSKGGDHEWQAAIYSRQAGKGCPICDGKKVVQSTCLATVNSELASEWHPTKNGYYTPFNIGPNSKKKLWWKCPKGDDHEWQAVVNNRNRGLGCPICSNQKIVFSNSLASLHPELAVQWHPQKNGKLTPLDVGAGSGRRVWWKCPEGDDHEWLAEIKKRSLGRGCPICIGRKVVDSNSVLSLYPELVAQLHPTKNSGLDPNKYRPYSNKLVWWKCPNADDHEWKTSFNMRVQGTGCPKCNSGKSAPELRLFCELKAIFSNVNNRERILGKEVDIFIPDINLGIEYDGWYWHKDKVAHDSKKSDDLEQEILLLRVREEGLTKISETDVMLKSKALTFDCVKKVLGAIQTVCVDGIEKYRPAIERYCRRKSWAAGIEFDRIQYERNGLAFERSIDYLYPEISGQWDFERNHPFVPDQFLPSSRKKVWWIDSSGHSWQAQIISRVRRINDYRESQRFQGQLF